MQDGAARCVGGRYDLLDPLGAGGGATVVRARDRQLPRQVAVKLLRSRDEELCRRFVQEAEVLSAIDHPSVVRVLDRGRDREDLYIVLELLAGPDLVLRPGEAPRPWREVIALGVEVAAALEAVHRQGLIHRDVKPANLVYAADGRVKLIDFGVVCITDNYRYPTGATPRRPTRGGSAPGTPGYQPLEAGLVEPSPGFDVYGLGATLYELLTGTLPGVPLRSLHEVAPGCDAPEDLWNVLAAALALEPEDRIQSAGELGRALAAVRAAHPERGAPSARIEGRYEIVGVAGSGAKADVFRAVHRGTGRDVVLKILRSANAEDGLRFAREAKLLDTLEHPAIPRLHDYAPAADPPLIAMAHAKGQPAVRLCTPPSLRPVEVAALGVKLAQVVAMLHARGVLHRDINASNVLVTDDGSVTLLDFGCAELEDKFYDVPAGERRYLTPPEARVAISDGGISRLAWSAPETQRGGRWTDRCDVYSIGHLLFRLLTGKVPTKGADPPSDPQALADPCPDDLAAAIMSALRVDPGARPSAAQLAEALRDVCETESESRARALAVVAPIGPPHLRLVRDAARVEAHSRDAEEDPEAGARPFALTRTGATVIVVGPFALTRAGASVIVVGAYASAICAAWFVRPHGPSTWIVSIFFCLLCARSLVRVHRRGSFEVADWRTRAVRFGEVAVLLVTFGALGYLAVRDDAVIAAARPDGDDPVAVDAFPRSPVASVERQATPAHTAVEPVSLLTVEAALAAVAPQLRTCAAIAEKTLVIRFDVAAGSERISSAAPLRASGGPVQQCIDRSLEPVRFASGPAKTVTVEYAP
jgi:serine/threonine protein kinase